MTTTELVRLDDVRTVRAMLPRTMSRAEVRVDSLMERLAAARRRDDQRMIERDAVVARNAAAKAATMARKAAAAHGQMTTAEKRAAIVEAIDRLPGHSDRAIARELGVDSKTVGAARKDVNYGPIPDAKRLSTAAGADRRLMGAVVDLLRGIDGSGLRGQGDFLVGLAQKELNRIEGQLK